MSRASLLPGSFGEAPTGSGHAPPTPSGYRSFAIEAVLADLERALCRDRCHAVVEAPPGRERAPLLRSLRERLTGAFRLVQLDSGVSDDEICERILEALGEDPGHDAEMRLLDVVAEIGGRGSALVVLLEDAGALSASALRRLGRLAAASRPDLRLALMVTVLPDDAAVGRVIAALGVGAEKLGLATRDERRRSPAPLGSPASPAPHTCPAPPAFPAAPARSEATRDAAHLAPERPLRPVRRLPLRSGALLLVGGTLALLGLQQLPEPAPDASAPDPQPVAEGPRAAVAPAEPAARALPEPRAAVAPAEPAARALPEPRAAVAPAEPAARPASEPVETPARREEPVASKPPAPAPKASPAPIPVSLNARPWAHVEVDGREVGVTPLANLRLAPGLHHFRARLSDGRVIARTLRIDANRDHVVFP
jgi:hypothetical protein